MSASKFFTDNINRLKKPDGMPTEPLAYNLNWGLLQLARQLDQIEQRQQRQDQTLEQIQKLLRNPR